MTTDENQNFKPGPAATSIISLSQAILAPLDAISKAQVHAARSFLNFVMQIAFPHIPDRNASTESASSEQMYMQTFRVKSGNGEGIASVPALALIPIQPLAIEKAQYDLELVVEALSYHQQMQASEEKELEKEPSNAEAIKEGKPHAPRKWYLVREPVSVRGTLSDPGGQNSGTPRKATVKVHVEVCRTDVPAGLAKIISSATQIASVTDNTTTKSGDPTAHPATNA